MITPFWSEKYVSLALYNAEVSRGIVHTPEYTAQMSALQREYDAELVAWAKRHGYVVFGIPGTYSSSGGNP